MTTGGRRVSGCREDELLSRLYQRLADEHAARFGASYDVAAGLRRYRAWLDERGAFGVDAAAPGVISAARTGAASAQPGTAGTAAPDAGPDAALAPGHAEAGRSVVPVAGASAADMAVTVLYQTQYRSLVRLAALLLPDAAAAEQVVQDAFIAMHRAWPKLASLERAESYLRQSVVSRCQLVHRHRIVMGRNAPRADEVLPDVPTQSEASVLAGLRELTARQRAVLVLGFYADMSEAQIAECMGISTSAVRLHTARAMSALRRATERAGRTDHPARTRPDADFNRATGREPT